MEVYDSAMEDQTRMRLTRALLDNQTLEQAALDSQARCEQLERAAQDDAATIDELRAKLAHVQQDAAELTDKNRALAEDAKKLSHELVASEQLAIAAVDKNAELSTAGVSQDMKIAEQEAAITDLREELHGLRQFVDARPSIYTEAIGNAMANSNSEADRLRNRIIELEARQQVLDRAADHKIHEIVREEALASMEAMEAKQAAETRLKEESAAFPEFAASRAAIEDLTNEELATSIEAKAAAEDPQGTKATIKGLLGSTYTSTDLALDAASLYSARRELYAATSPTMGDGRKGLSSAAEAERQALLMLAANAAYEKAAAVMKDVEEAEEEGEEKGEEEGEAGMELA